MGSVLVPVSDPAYSNGHLDWYGAVEIALATGRELWRFDATETEFETARFYRDDGVLRRTGFRPASVQRLGDGTTLIADWHRGVLVDEDGDVVRTFTHELMNDVHEIQRTPDGRFLVASTGMDTLLLLDEDFEELWRWHMWEHVDRGTRPEGYYPDRIWHSDTRNLALHPDDRYHLNYATVLDDDTFLCSALNYGVFTVDPDTGGVERTYTDLDECHNPYPTSKGYVVPESGADRVVSLDWGREPETVFEGGLNFVKDADPMGGGDWLLADTKNDRVLVWNRDEGEPRREFHLGHDAMPYEADYLEAGDVSTD